MKLLVVLILSLAGTITGYSYHLIADSDQSIVDVIQIADNASFTAATPLILITGSWVHISTILFFVSMVSAGQRKLKGHLLLVERLREMEEVNQELRRLNSVKDILLSITSHDIRAPLVSLQSLLELVARKKLTANEFNQMVFEISNHVAYVKGFIDNLLYWAKENFSQIKPRNEKLILRPLVNETIGLLALNAKKKQITIQTDVSDEVMIYADVEMTKLVIRNLISNAIKFCDVNDKIDVRVAMENEMARVSVVDTGQGISEKNIATLFSVSHLSASGTDDEIGVGLGLTLCKEFVEKMGGNISVSSKEGHGSCFEFTVPRFIKKETSTEAAQPIFSNP